MSGPNKFEPVTPSELTNVTRNNSMSKLFDTFSNTLEANNSSKEEEMPWTPWIQIETDETSQEGTEKHRKKAAKSSTSNKSDLTRLTSLTPEVSECLDRLCTAVYRNTTGLTVREKEIVALVTSSFIGCVH